MAKPARIAEVRSGSNPALKGPSRAKSASPSETEIRRELDNCSFVPMTGYVLVLIRLGRERFVGRGAWALSTLQQVRFTDIANVKSGMLRFRAETGFVEGTSSWSVTDIQQLRARGAATEVGMADYLLIESRDPFESNDVGYYFELARGLAEAGNGVTLFLVQNAVFAARPSGEAPKLRALANSGVRIMADDFALKERGITKLCDGVEVAPIEIVVDHLEAGHKTLWH